MLLLLSINAIKHMSVASRAPPQENIEFSIRRNDQQRQPSHEFF
jgi:hypothetical protein